ncbi:MAG: hypothetical protein JSV88_09980 [Candidatus Aminicenantes bacterium]|nr:MAG: hypothetical protein JSV88_09980 [Candidatus Aminicenantes bacterium]
MKSRKANLKQFVCLLITIFCCGSLVLTAQITPPQKTDLSIPKQLQDIFPPENTEVVNISLVLRALKQGQPVAGLQQKDFTLYEKGKPRPLTNFQEFRRKVGRHVEDKTTPAPAAKNRFFFLYFRVSEPDPKIPETLDYFFSQVYRDGDYALLIVGNRVFPITRRSQVEPALASFNTSLAHWVEKTSLARQKLAASLEQLVRQFLEEDRIDVDTLRKQNVNLLISNFKNVWLEYKQHYIFQPDDKLNLVADSLKKINIEKWGFVFYQQDSFPSLNLMTILGPGVNSPGRIARLRRQLEQFAPRLSNTRQSLQTINYFQQALIEANVTLHLLLSNPPSPGKLDTMYLDHKAAYTDWQRAFRNISQATGGSIIEDNNVQKSLAQALEREDVFYRLTYAPATVGEEHRNIQIRTKLPGIKLQYHREVTVSPADKIAVHHFSFSHPFLEFALKNYRQFFDGTRMYGDIEVKITTVDSSGNQRTFKKILEPLLDEVAVSMNLDFPSGGDYSLIIEAHDRQAGQTATVNQPITVPKSKYQLEPVLVTETLKEMKGARYKRTLDSLLKKSARYCQKLKKTTFHFTCTEEVIDSHWYRGNLVREDNYLYDYQIIREENGKMNENRKLKPESEAFLAIKKKETGKTGDQETILTNFFSSYPYLMPVSMLAEENQSKYRYRLLDRKTSARRTLYKVSVEPKEEGVMIKDSNYGVVWIDEKDGSVYKIQLNPNSLDGLKQLTQLAWQKRQRLKVSDVHWYEVQRKGIRFPSRTEINCSFLDWDQVKKMWERLRSAALEKMGTVFEYKKYKFFNVNVDVVETDPQ